jgi:hypothetical protein
VKINYERNLHLVQTHAAALVSAMAMTMAALGVEMQLLLPGYPKAIESATNKSVEVKLSDFMGAGPIRLISARTPDTALPVWLVDCPSLFWRSGGPYQDEDGQDWPDNAQRFAVFNHIAAQASLGLLLASGGPMLSMPMIGTPGYCRRSWPEPPSKGLRQCSRCTTSPFRVCFPLTSIRSWAFLMTALSRTDLSSMARYRSSKPASATAIA